MGKVTSRISNVCGLAVVSGGLLGLTGFASMSLATPEVSAELANASVNVTEACAMTSTGNTTHTAEVDNGRYVDNIGTTSFNVTCNDAGGFSVYAVGFTGDEIGGANSTKLVGSASAGLISTGTATSGENSAWAMKLATSATATYPVSILGGYDSYSSVPTSYTKVATRTGTTDTGTGATGASFTTTYAAYVNSGQTADTYNGKVKYTLVHPANEMPLQPQVATPGCINYFANASSAEGTMGCQPISNTDTSATLLASNFSRTGYGFAGWSDKYDYATNSSAKFYGPQETITFTAGQYTGSNNGLALYAVWVKSEGSLQNATKVAELCGTGSNALITAPTDGTANLDSVSALTDQRDNNTYAIAKLADGKCWMIENLRLEAENTRTPEKQALAQDYGASTTYGNFSGLADAESTSFSNSTTANSLYYSGTQSGDATINIGTTNYPGYRMPRYNNLNTTNRATNPTSNTFNNTTGGMYSYGNYYTWHSAIADLTFNGTNNNSTTGTSLCPTGWHLPTGGAAYASGNTSGVNITGDTSTFREFYNLGYKIMDEIKTAYEDTPSSGYAYYSSNTINTAGKTAIAAIRSFPNNFLFSGYFSASSASNRGSSGYYWSSTAYGNSSSYYQRLDISNVAPGTNSNYKYYGFSIRCTVSAGI